MENKLNITNITESNLDNNIAQGFSKTINFEMNEINYEYSYFNVDNNVYVTITDKDNELYLFAIHNDEKYVNKLIVNEDLFNLFKENNMIDKNENYNDFKDLSKEIMISADKYLYDDLREVDFIYNNNKYFYMSEGNKETIRLVLDGLNYDLVFDKEKNFVGSGVDVIYYDSKILDENFFNALKNNDVISNLFDYKDYNDFCKNLIDITNKKETVDLER